MPVLDGYEATHEIRARVGTAARADRRHDRDALQGDREKCLAAGMDDYLTKPLKRSVLAEMLARWLPAMAQPNAAEEQPPAIDMTALANLAELMSEGVGEVLRVYLSDTPTQLDTMDQAIAASDEETLRRAAHSVKSSSKSLGVTVIGRLAESLELLGTDTDWKPDAERLVAAMRTAYQTAEHEIVEMLAVESGRIPGTAHALDQTGTFVKSSHDHARRATRGGAR